MRDRLRRAANSPLFQVGIMVEVTKLTSAAESLSAMGIDVVDNIKEILQSISGQINNVAYDITNLDELLKDAQAIGEDEIVEKKETRDDESGSQKTDDTNKGNLGEPDKLY